MVEEPLCTTSFSKCCPLQYAKGNAKGLLDMRSQIALGLLVAAAAVVVTSAWTISEVGKNNRAIRNGFDALNARVDRLRPGTVGHEHSDVRKFVIATHLARTKSPIVFLGDSITEAAVVPDSICGRPVVNAGIGGAGVDDLLRVAPSLLD